MFRILSSSAIATLLLLSAFTQAGLSSEKQEKLDPTGWTCGPEHGSLVIVGGTGSGVDPQTGERYSNLIFSEFVELAGGAEIPLVIVPTSSDPDKLTDFEVIPLVKFAREKLGMDHVTVLHTDDPRTADTEEFVAPLKTAKAIWFTGGRQWRTTKVYLGTRAEKEFREVLNRGGVIGGSSAGATVQGTFLIRGAVRGNEILIGEQTVGFGYITNSVIDQHVVARSRLNDLTKLLQTAASKFPSGSSPEKLLGIGIDEDAAIIVKGDQFTVSGKPDARVFVYDPTSWTEGMSDSERYQILKRNDRYDLRKRQIITSR